MQMCGGTDNISRLLSKSMESWQTILRSGNEELARVNIHGDTPSRFLFVIGLIP